MMFPVERVLTGPWIPGAVMVALASGLTVSAAAQDAVPKRCTGCHTESAIVERVAKIPADQRRAKIEAFLANHYTPDATERAAIVRALADKAASRP